uniref:bifunctional polynucleotide phosphatase/kinase n=1 Tax=Ciona intestinalis TaxID=7719 RepID=UPI000180B3F5|nr:bifunctional polynucleotide phosphatase/kinase [Ciona intestinalis]|eukprot:XP_002127397.1 bifunctional polynucleotide phosphatase/kinase [Ciona intestinalis]
MEIYLQCCDGHHDDIFLPDGQAVVVGRSEATKITDKRCSRKQLELTADYSNKSVTVRQLGSTPGCIDGKPLDHNNIASLHENETLCVVQKEFPHKLLFVTNDNQGEETTSTLNKKRTLTDYFVNNNVPKSKKLKKDLKEDNIEEKLKQLQQQSFSKPKTDTKPPVSTTTSQCEIGWSTVDQSMLVYQSEGLKHSSQVVAFDLDSTLITTKSGKTFATDYKDWKIMLGEIPKKLKQLSAEGVKIVIISNQNGISKGKVKEEDFKKKAEAVVKALGVPCQVLAATKRCKYRKPNIGSYNWLCDYGNGGIKVDDFTYVGDAAGRAKNWEPKRKKDFSCSDRLFALNLNVPFFTPEEYFLNQKPAKFTLPEFDPKSLKSSSKELTSVGNIVSNQQEVLILVGYPACGKSTFTRQHLVPKGYVQINRDTLKTWQKCVAACKSALASGKSVAIDNTNPDIESRKRYIDCAKERKCPCRCLYFDISIEHAFHNNRFRELSGTAHDIISSMIIYSHRKKFVEPTTKEGFDEIVKVNFVPSFENKELERMYYMYNV